MATQRVHIRVASNDDIPSLIELDSIAQRDSQRKALIADAIAFEQCWVATEKDNRNSALGYGVLNQSFFEQNFVQLLVVRETARRRGVASAILRELQAQCRGTKLFTSTNSSNVPMRALLLQCGFAASGHIDNLDKGDPELIFVKLTAD